MSRVPWHLFQDRKPRAHLIVGVLVLADGPAGGDELTAAQSVLLRLVRKQKPASDYASTVVRDAGWPEISSDLGATSTPRAAPAVTVLHVAHGIRELVRRPGGRC